MLLYFFISDYGQSFSRGDTNGGTHADDRLSGTAEPHDTLLHRFVEKQEVVNAAVLLENYESMIWRMISRFYKKKIIIKTREITCQTLIVQ